MSRTSYASTRKYRDKSYDQINVVIPKGRKKDIAEYATSNGQTINGLISELLQEKIGMSEEEWKKKEVV